MVDEVRRIVQPGQVATASAGAKLSRCKTQFSPSLPLGRRAPEKWPSPFTGLLSTFQAPSATSAVQPPQVTPHSVLSCKSCSSCKSCYCRSTRSAKRQSSQIPATATATPHSVPSSSRAPAGHSIANPTRPPNGCRVCGHHSSATPLLPGRRGLVALVILVPLEAKHASGVVFPLEFLLCSHE